MQKEQIISILNRINELRELKGWTKSELASHAGISTDSVYNWYKEETLPSLTNIELICKAVDITIEQFFCDIDSIPEDEKELLNNWMFLSDLEKKAVFDLIDVFKASR